MSRLTFKDSRPGREQVQDQLRTLIRKSRELIEPVDADTFNRRPAANSWSAAECLDHLNTSARLYLPVLTEAIEKARGEGLTGGEGDGRTWLGKLICWMQEPPPRFKTKTWDDIRPASERLEPEAALDEFEALHEELIVRINEASDLNLKKIKVRSALDTRLRLSLGDWFAFLAVHARRHLWQANAALESARRQDPTA